MADGSIKEYPEVEILATQPTDVGDGKYVKNAQSSNIYSFSQIHIFRYGRVVEANIVMTVKNSTNETYAPGKSIQCFHFALRPIYTLRAICFPANTTENGDQPKGHVGITGGNTGDAEVNNGRVIFYCYNEIAPGGTCTFRFNITYLTED